ncbi:MAG TPA: 50S ribosomal protein L11 methyltransferase, partial [Paracoccus sp.]|nr:50S ribosomal protein L11 methyltransferase [Paracoccus sp. (in: a-proteobacteria)]
GVGVFELEDGSDLWEVGAYFTETPDDIALALLAAAHGAAPFAVSELPEIDWVAHVRRELKPVEAGRFFVYGSHDADKLPKGRVGLLIEAAMAFGTGHHGTTLGCLKALDRLADAGFQGRNVIDVGCGTAVLAMAAARIWPDPVLASDIDAVAVEVAEANVEANDLRGRVECLEAVGFDHPRITQRAPFDLVFANILKGPLIALAPDMARHTAPGGYAILSGLLVTQADDVLAAYTAEGFALHHREDLGEWSVLTLTPG